jgi:anti-anti-sigma regulatory factor
MFARTKQGAVDVVYGDDPLNEDNAPRVQRLLDECGGHVPLIDSTGLEMLLDVQEGFQRRGGTLKLAVRSPLCREILSVTGVGRHFEMFPEAASAVGSFVQ